MSGYNMRTLVMVNDCIDREIIRGNWGAVDILNGLRREVMADIKESLDPRHPIRVWLEGTEVCDLPHLP